MEVSVVLKASIIAATGGGLLDCLVQTLWPEEEEDDACEYEYAYADVDEEDDLVDLARAVKTGAVVAMATPLVIGGAIHTFAGIPWSFVARVTGITEAIVAPIGAILLQVDECGGALYRNFPTFVLVSCWSTFLTTYTLSAVIYHHRIAFLPIISSTGERFPENIVWALGGLASGLALIGMARGFTFGYVGQPVALRRRAGAATKLGYVGGVAMIMVGVFRSGPSWTNVVHMTSVMLAGACTTFSLMVHSRMATEVQANSYSPRASCSSYKEQVALRSRRLAYVYSTVASCCLFFSIGNIGPIVAAALEYVTVIFWSLTVSTFSIDFQHQMVGQAAASWGSGLGRRMSSRTLSIHSEKAFNLSK